MSAGLGKGRPLIAIGGTLALVGSFLPWVSAGESTGRVVTGNGLSGMGILVFVSAVLSLMCILLPYASASGRSGVDQPPAYALLAGLAVIGLLLTLAQLHSQLLALAQLLRQLFTVGTGSIRRNKRRQVL